MLVTWEQADRGRLIVEDADPQGRLLDQAQGLARDFLRSLPDRPVGHAPRSRPCAATRPDR
jgi:hypothetical protein